jgi:Tfp pilus assembly protein PilF
MRQAVLANAAALIGGLFAVSPALAPLAAQTAPSTCSVDQGKPKELALAWLNLSKAQSLAAGPARETVLKQMSKDLLDNSAKYTSNPGGYYYLLSQIFTLMAAQPNGLTPTTRGAIGLATRPTEPFDVVVELDSAYTKFEAAAPSCKADIAQSRTNEAWLAVTNKAFTASTAGQNDSALFWAKRSIMLAPNNPFPHHILATVAQNTKDNATAVAEWKKVVSMAGSDTLYRDIKMTSLFYLGVSNLQEAAGKTGDASKTQALEAAGYLKEFLAANPTGPDAPNVMNNLGQAYMLAGDTTQARGIYADELANPTKYTEPALLTGGVIASQAGDLKGSATLFQAAVQANPKSRDGLRNVASTHYQLGEFSQMFTPLYALMAIDPNNYDAIMMFAYAAQDIGKASKIPAEKKAWTDSLVKYSTMAEKLPAKVDVAGFTRGATSAEVTVAVEQMAEAPSGYTVTMDFLDKTGAVVGTDSKKIDPMKKGEHKTVVLTGNAPGIVGFQYKLK